jgi:hypothetical protein
LSCHRRIRSGIVELNCTICWRRLFGHVVCASLNLLTLFVWSCCSCLSEFRVSAWWLCEGTDVRLKKNTHSWCELQNMYEWSSQ